MKNNKIVITGGAGFLGKHLVALLIQNGFENITVVDKVKTKIDKVKFVQGDFADEKIMKPLLENCDALFHLAAIIGVDNCRNHPDLVKQVNYTNTKNLIDWCVELRVKRIIFTSSSEVYGNSKDIPYKEDCKLEPVSVYGQMKVEIEKHLQDIQKTNNITVGIVRLFNVYGPGQKKDFVVSIFINAAINNSPIQIFGKGNQTRTFAYVKDVAKGILKLYEYNKTPYEIVNLGGNQEYSISGLAKAVLALIPTSNSKIEYLMHGKAGVRTSSYEIDRRVPSIEKGKKLLDFEAKTTLKEGLAKTIEYIKSTNQLQ